MCQDRPLVQSWEQFIWLWTRLIFCNSIIMMKCCIMIGPLTHSQNLIGQVKTAINGIVQCD